MKVDVAKFQQTFTGVSQDLQDSALKVSVSIRYGQHAEAVAELDKLAENPGLTEQQKKVAAEVREQLRQVVSQLQARSGP